MPPATRRRAPAATEPAPERRMQSAAARQRGQATQVEPAHMHTTSGVKKHGYSESSDEAIENVEFQPGQEPAFVRVAAGKTIDMGNFEFLRIDVAVTYPCLPSKVDETYERAAEWVADKMVNEEQRWLGTPANTKRNATRNR